MIAIGDTIVSEHLLEKKFVCDLNACKGECCVAGDAGAPLDEDELRKLKEVFPAVKPYMQPEGIKAVEEYGVYVFDEDGDYVTPLIDGKECAFTIFDDKGIAKCAIEQAFYDGKIDYKKPISCHLYPIRITKYKDYDAVNYHKWEVCRAACRCGDKLNVPVYRFLKDPLIRKYGEEWYKQLEMADKMRK